MRVHYYLWGLVETGLGKREGETRYPSTTDPSDHEVGDLPLRVRKVERTGLGRVSVGLVGARCRHKSFAQMRFRPGLSVSLFRRKATQDEGLVG